jgi:hypothetical protein
VWKELLGGYMKWWNVWWRALKDSWLGNALYWLGVIVSAIFGYGLGRLVEGEMLGGLMIVIAGFTLIATVFAAMRINSMKRNVFFVASVLILSLVLYASMVLGHYAR